MEGFNFLFFFMITGDNKIYMCIHNLMLVLVANRIGHPLTGKGEKFRKFRTSLPPAHLLSTGAIIERLYIYEE